MHMNMFSGTCRLTCADHLQAGALVLVYADGEVLITHGGTEMGQVCGSGMVVSMMMVVMVVMARLQVVFRVCTFAFTDCTGHLGSV